ncbi:hypothetical protein GCM10009547_35900 [Sporichthya brevicatena]|uniref:Uncharacterized protein n=1 Tax=Sporichthya brevicatena TaxID=171442 RepID=A0ABP3S8Z7_9ACTN
MNDPRRDAETAVRSIIRSNPGLCLLDGLLGPWFDLPSSAAWRRRSPWPSGLDVRAAFALLNEDVPAAAVDKLSKAEENATPTDTQRHEYETRSREHSRSWELPEAADLSAHIELDLAWRRVDGSEQVGNPAGLLANPRWWPGRDASGDPAGLSGAVRAGEEHPDLHQHEVVAGLLRLLQRPIETSPRHWIVAANDYRVRTARWLDAVSTAAGALRTPAGLCLLATVIAAVKADTEGPLTARAPRLRASADAVRRAFAKINDPLSDDALASLLDAEPGTGRGALVRTPLAVVERLDGTWGPDDRVKPPFFWALPAGTDTDGYAEAWAHHPDPANDLPSQQPPDAGADWLLAATERRVRDRLARYPATQATGGRRGWRRWLPTGRG